MRMYFDNPVILLLCIRVKSYFITFIRNLLFANFIGNYIGCHERRYFGRKL